MGDCVKKGYTKLRVIYQKPYVSRINFQISDDDSVILSMAGNTDELETGAIITHEHFCKDMKKFYRKVWDDASKIIESGINWDELSKLVDSIDKTQIDKINLLREKYPEI